MNKTKSASTVVVLAIIGLLFGGIVGFWFQPPATVASINYVLGATMIGVIIGGLAGLIVPKKKRLVQIIGFSAAVLIILGFVSIVSPRIRLMRQTLNANNEVAASKACDARMWEIKKAAEAYFHKTGNSPANLNPLIEQGYLSRDKAKNLHGRPYAITWEEGKAIIHCITDASGHVTFPPGHAPEGEDNPYYE